MDNIRALVLCGGGAKGGYHIGVWKALKELGYQPQIITGTSVGALNGALLSIGEDEVAENIWKNMNMETVFEKKPNEDINSIHSVNEFMIKLGKLGGVDPKPLKELSRSFGSEEKFRKAPITFGLVTTRLNPLKKVEKFVDEMKEGKVIDYVLASTACFPIMQKYSIDGVEYVDGGYTDNLPFEMALRRGATELVLVDMHGMMHVNTPEDYAVKIHYISPTQDLGNFMLFNQEQSQKNMQLGYFDTMKVFRKLEGTRYTFEPGTVEKTEAYNQICRETYKRVFTDLPKVSPLEKLAHNHFYKFLYQYTSDVFLTTNNVVDALEIAASIYAVNPYELYSFQTLLSKVVTSYQQTIQDDTYIKRMSLKEIKKSSLPELKKMVAGYDKKDLTAYIVYLLQRAKITMVQKNQILAITAIWPECLCAAIIILNHQVFGKVEAKNV